MSYKLRNDEKRSGPLKAKIMVLPLLAIIFLCLPEASLARDEPCDPGQHYKGELMVVCVFENCGYKGNSSVSGAGVVPNLNKFQIGNWISAVKLYPNYAMVLSSANNYQGSSVILTSNTQCLSSDNFDNKANSSITLPINIDLDPRGGFLKIAFFLRALHTISNHSGSSTRLQPGSDVYFITMDSITLNPGFSVEKGGNFTAAIARTPAELANGNNAFPGALTAEEGAGAFIKQSSQ